MWWRDVVTAAGHTPLLAPLQLCRRRLAHVPLGLTLATVRGKPARQRRSSANSGKQGLAELHTPREEALAPRLPALGQAAQRVRQLPRERRRAAAHRGARRVCRRLGCQQAAQRGRRARVQGGGERAAAAALHALRAQDPAWGLGLRQGCCAMPSRSHDVGREGRASYAPPTMPAGQPRHSRLTLTNCTRSMHAYP